MHLSDGISIDQLIERALALKPRLPKECEVAVGQIEELYARLSRGQLRLAVLGQFNRGKSSFINALLGKELLPISVLPLTSVPTVICQGRSTRCTVRFFNGMPPRHADELEGIARLLLSYVTEQNNPKNRHCVAEVVVECDSPLLASGTELVDTPGFGSTFVHNTKTTVDYLSESDAALFLLSADLPITQTEIEFLKQVHRYVPRIFFVFNKIDLLSPEELQTSQAFIIRTLQEQLDFAADARLYPVSARNALKRGKDCGGIAEVKAEIIEFLLREKFFALSHALTRKLRDALEVIVNYHQQRVQQLTLAREQTQASALAMSALLEAARKRLKQEREIYLQEERVVSEFLQRLSEQQLQTLVERIEPALRELVGASTQPEAVVRSALPAMVQQWFDTLYREALLQLNKPLRNVARIRQRHFDGLCEELKRQLPPSIQLPQVERELVEGVQLEPGQEWAVESGGELLKGLVQDALLQRLQAGRKRSARVHEAAVPVLQQLLQTNHARLFDHLQQRVQGLLDGLSATLEQDYEVVLGALERECEAARLIAQEAAQRYREPLDEAMEVGELFVAIRGAVVG
jgi:GTP-binding protein EngB required for normal cell division